MNSRYSAVHGGTFILKSEIQSIERVNLQHDNNEMRFKLIVKEGDACHTFYSRYLVVSPSYRPLVDKIMTCPPSYTR